mgnify:CR=1 FL=1
MSQNEENETVDSPAEAPAHPTQPAEANPEVRLISMQSEEPAESVESIESVETKTDGAEIVDITEDAEIDAKDIPDSQGIRLVDEAEETPADSLRIRRIDDEAEPAQAQAQTQTQSPTQSQTDRPAQASRSRTPRNVGRETRSEGQGRRVLTAVRSRAPRFVSDQEAYVPNVEQVTRQQTSDYSRAFITKRVTVRSNRSQILFEHGYDRVDYSLQILTGVISEISSDKFADQVQNRVESMFDELEENLDKTIESTKAMLEKRGLSDRDGQSAYDHPRTYETPVRSPFSIRYLNLIGKHDLLTSLVDCLWLNGYMPSRVQTQSSRLWESRFRRFARDLNVLRTETLNEIGERNNRRVRGMRDQIRDQIRNGSEATQREAARLVANRSGSEEIEAEAKIEAKAETGAE